MTRLIRSRPTETSVELAQVSLDVTRRHATRARGDSKRRWRLRTSFGSKLPSHSRGVVTSGGPCSVPSDLGVEPFRVMPVLPGGS